MLIVKVWCLPKSSEEELRKIHKAVVAAVISVTGFVPGTSIKSEKDLLVLFPADLMGYGLGDEIAVEVTGIDYRGLSRSNTVQLLRRIGEALAVIFEKSYVECREIHSDMDDPFWSSGKPT
jgi:hypothetical protein